MAYNSTSKTGMSKAAREAQRQYNREWRKANRDKVREYNERYWMKKAAQAGSVNNG